MYEQQLTWGRMTWPDIVTMVIMGMFSHCHAVCHQPELTILKSSGAIALGVYFAHPAPSRSFPIYVQDGEVIYPDFAYPLRSQIIPIWAAALLAIFVPIVVILFLQIRIRSFWDINNSIIGLFYSLITAAVFQVFLK